MKRRIIAMVIVSTALGAVLTGCSRRGEGAAGVEDASAPSTWVQPPHIDGVAREGASLIVRGAAGPNARVVLRGADGSAVAVSADGAGRFELRAPLSSGDIRLRPEVQVGENAAASPETLVVVQGGAGPIVLIAAGEPTQRLDGRGVLDAVDTDGEATLISGRSDGEPPSVTVGGQAVQVTGQSGGAWRITRPGVGAAVLVVGGQAFDFPGVGAQSDFAPVRVGDGWRITWPTGPSGRQTTWLPDRR